MSSPRVIKKYPNRRLYDTEISQYITLADVRKLVMSGAEFTVIDANSEEDITRSILLQIILDQESGGEPLFTTEVLARMIRFYGDSAQGLFTDYLGKSIDLFSEQQAQMQTQMRDMLSKNPIDTMSEMTQRNLEIWRELQDNFLRTSGIGNRKKDSD